MVISGNSRCLQSTTINLRHSFLLQKQRGRISHRSEAVPNPNTSRAAGGHGAMCTGVHRSLYRRDFIMLPGQEHLRLAAVKINQSSGRFRGTFDPVASAMSAMCRARVIPARKRAVLGRCENPSPSLTQINTFGRADSPQHCHRVATSALQNPLERASTIITRVYSDKDIPALAFTTLSSEQRTPETSPVRWWLLGWRPWGSVQGLWL